MKPFFIICCIIVLISIMNDNQRGRTPIPSNYWKLSTFSEVEEISPYLRILKEHANDLEVTREVHEAFWKVQLFTVKNNPKYKSILKKSYKVMDHQKKMEIKFLQDAKQTFIKKKVIVSKELREAILVHIDNINDLTSDLDKVSHYPDYDDFLKFIHFDLFSKSSDVEGNILAHLELIVKGLGYRQLEKRDEYERIGIQDIETHLKNKKLEYRRQRILCNEEYNPNIE